MKKVFPLKLAVSCSLAMLLAACGGGGGGGGSNDTPAANPNAFKVLGNNAVRLMAGAIQVPQNAASFSSVNPTPFAYLNKDTGQFKQENSLVMTHLGSAGSNTSTFDFSGDFKEVTGAPGFAQGRWVKGSLGIADNPALAGTYSLNEPLQSISYLVFNQITMALDPHPRTCQNAVATTATVVGYNSLDLSSAYAQIWAGLPDSATTTGTATLTATATTVVVNMNLTVTVGNSVVRFNNLQPSNTLGNGIMTPFTGAVFQQYVGSNYINGTASIGYDGKSNNLIAVQYQVLIPNPLSAQARVPTKIYAGTLYFVCS